MMLTFHADMFHVDISRYFFMKIFMTIVARKQI